MAEMVMLAAVAVAGVDAILAGILLVLYARSFRKVRAPFTVGLLMFAGLLLVQNLLAVYAYFTMMESFPAAMAPYTLGINLFEGLALAVMLYSAWQ